MAAPHSSTKHFGILIGAILRLAARAPLFSVPLFATCFAFIAGAQETADLEELVGKWVQIRKEVAVLQANWNEERQVLQYERELLQDKHARLQEAVQRQETAEQELESRRQKLEGNAQSLRADLRELEASLKTAEQKMLDLRPKLPVFLQEQLVENFNLLKTHSAPEPDAVAQHARRIFDMLAAMESAASSLHNVPVLLNAPDGSERELDALFLGIAVGYAVTPDGSQAAVGRPGQDGWTWEWMPEYAENIQTAILVYNKGAAAELVKLPLQLDASP